MTLIKSISGIRGTIGGTIGNNLTPLDIVKFTTAFGIQQKNKFPNKKITIVVGKDSRPSGFMLESIICATLSGLGINVINIGLASTPTVEIAVIEEKANGGIIITASHNPIERNALKLLNKDGEFLSKKDGEDLIKILEENNFEFSSVNNLGKITEKFIYDDIHIKKILDLELVDQKIIAQAKFTIVLDGINSVGGIIVPKLLEKLGVNTIKLNCDASGQFAHNPEPLPKNLTEISKKIKNTNADLGIVVDPDVDRLAFVDENGIMFGEEYTLVAIADYILQHEKGPTVSNFLSSRALRDISNKYNTKHLQSSVGEVNVVNLMKKIQSPIGGEGNGGVIYPKLHYGRDALVGIALFLTFLAKSQKKCSKLRKQYPDYFISKNKIILNNIEPDIIIQEMLEKYKKENKNIKNIDGIRLEFDDSRVHFRKSNTEAIIRVYAEAKTKDEAEQIAQKTINDINSIL